MLAAPPPAPPPIVVVDPAGDSGTAPDISKVRVTTGAKGRIAFVVVFATKYGSDSSLYVYIGSEYRLGPGGLEVWDPPANDFEPLGSESGTFAVAPGGRALAASVDASELGNPKTFRFTVQSIDGDGGTGHVDVTAAATWRRAER
ncbi:MAG TPA: hypothetical protein VFW41_01650 [Gaiellaceae bacterium]|nr:hypothetical protein [Gaiellaceae bacterium]